SSIKVGFSNPIGNGASCQKSGNRTSESEQSRFGREEQSNSPVGGAQGFHNGEILASLQNRAGQRSDQAQHDQGDEDGRRRRNQRTRGAYNRGLRCRDLAYRFDLELRKSRAESVDRVSNLPRAALDAYQSCIRRYAGKSCELSQIEINATVVI